MHGVRYDIPWSVAGAIVGIHSTRSTVAVVQQVVDCFCPCVQRGGCCLLAYLLTSFPSFYHHYYYYP